MTQRFTLSVVHDMPISSLDYPFSPLLATQIPIVHRAEILNSPGFADFQTHLEQQVPCQSLPNDNCAASRTDGQLTVEHDAESLSERDFFDDVPIPEMIFTGDYLAFSNLQQIGLEEPAGPYPSPPINGQSAPDWLDQNMPETTLIDDQAIPAQTTAVRESETGESKPPSSPEELPPTTNDQDSKHICSNAAIAAHRQSDESIKSDLILMRSDTAADQNGIAPQEMPQIAPVANDAPPIRYGHDTSKLPSDFVMVLHRETQAELKLAPETLGRVDISMDVDVTGANILLDAQHKTSQHYIEQHLPQLARDIESAGVPLANLAFGHHDHGKRHGQPEVRLQRWASVGKIKSGNVPAQARRYQIVDQLA